jgi:TetR/AcrR family transcriptional regulator, repressor for uid operon
MPPPVKLSMRTTRRLQTRERILGAAIVEFKRSGMVGAEVSSIAAAAGVAHGTFYFHFPTKEHVLFEVERREEAALAARLARFLETTQDLSAVLTKVVELVLGLERRVGVILFKEILGSHFSSSRPQDDWNDHPMIVLLVDAIERARGEGAVHSEVDAFYSAIFFLLGIYGVLCATDSAASRGPLLSKSVASAVRGLAVR